MARHRCDNFSKGSVLPGRNNVEKSPTYTLQWKIWFESSFILFLLLKATNISKPLQIYCQRRIGIEFVIFLRIAYSFILVWKHDARYKFRNRQNSDSTQHARKYSYSYYLCPILKNLYFRLSSRGLLVTSTLWPHVSPQKRGEERVCLRVGVHQGWRYWMPNWWANKLRVDRFTKLIKKKQLT